MLLALSVFLVQLLAFNKKEKLNDVDKRKN